MAISGAKPKATLIKLMTGNPGKRPLPQNEPLVTGPLGDPPADMIEKREIRLWNEIVKVVPWLTAADRYKLHIWCSMQAEFEDIGRDMSSPRIAQLRALGSELGLDPASRARLGKDIDASKPKGEGSEYFQ